MNENEQALDDWAAALAEQQAADEAAAATTSSPAPSMMGSQSNVSPADIFERFDATPSQPTVPNNIDMIMDIPVTLTVELGRTKIAIRSLLQLAQGSVVELDGLAGEPMDVLVNGCLIAQGEVVVVNDKFGIRLTDIITPAERIRRLHK
ncbi:flagellar motor switch protein FliN [Parachitinimonas caeni]|uniref:Flagellar motor switch protein FliN n=1 Tax=Parachitinimonas caeni TaxID=3031301 RepID=A0ABT7DUP8_9NEIS|nr:flagellar motor switch protein FliN [Parachitinimonas caeni]MDK2123787.1 flagellar motor switch protein FliN [Parachitinimonas caeni]